MTGPLQVRLSIEIRPMDLGNIADVAAALPTWDVERWHTQDEMLSHCVEHHGLGLVAWKVRNGVLTTVAGYCLFRRRTSSLYLDYVAVSPEFRRCGVGRDLAAHVTSQASPAGPRRVFCEADQRNLSAHLWLKACGFRACAVNPVTYRFRFDAGEREAC